ncbi:hypothetical protein [Nostoc sp. NOS(2021)]|nr:hypothetical protein [Nostoc sp. NOS(2021)]
MSDRFFLEATNLYTYSDKLRQIILERGAMSTTGYAYAILFE